MGKKVAFGCLGVVAAVIIVGGLLFYSLLWRPVMRSLNTLETINRANERIINQSPYEPPPDGQLEPAQVERFVAVQKRINENLEQTIAELQEQYETLSEDWQNRDPNLREMMTAWQDVLQLLADAKEIQVEALNQENFSLQEYQFVRGAFYRALGFDLMPYSLDSIAAAAEQRELVFDMEELKTAEREFTGEALEKNRELVSEHADTAEEWLIFAWWGL